MRVAATAPAALAGRGGASRATVAAAAPAPAPIVTPVPRAEKSRLASALARGQFVVLAELDPPRGHAAQEFIDLGRQLRIRGVDALLVTDRPASRARMAPLAAALLLERQAGIETVLQFRCRERRLAAMQAELLGAHALGLRNILVVTGEPVRRADYTDATALVEADSIGVTNAVSRLNHGTDLGGQPIGEPTAFHTGVRVSPSSLDLDEELRRYRYKAEAGAEFVLTEPVFDVADVTHFRARGRDVELPLVVTVRTLGSLREAERLANEVPGQRVPQALLERMRQAVSTGTEAAEGVAIAQELAEAIRPYAQGIVVSGARPDLVFPVIARTLDAAQFR
jgi:homocysteine S-methyltransferase